MFKKLNEDFIIIYLIMIIKENKIKDIYKFFQSKNRLTIKKVFFG
jgi:hypothetical protein